MNSVLDTIADWPERARAAHFNVAMLASLCHVSVAHLSRFIHWKFRRTPHL